MWRCVALSVDTLVASVLVCTCALARLVRSSCSHINLSPATGNGFRSEAVSARIMVRLNYECDHDALPPMPTKGQSKIQVSLLHIINWQPYIQRAQLVKTTIHCSSCQPYGRGWRERTKYYKAKICKKKTPSPWKSRYLHILALYLLSCSSSSSLILVVFVIS